MHKFQKYIACVLCGELTCRRGWKQRYCKKCAPNMKAHRRCSRYNLSQTEFQKMFDNQCGKCALCKCELHTLNINGMHVDHNHTTNKVRGLLCGECNHGIGHIERLLKSSMLKCVLHYLDISYDTNN